MSKSQTTQEAPARPSMKRVAATGVAVALIGMTARRASHGPVRDADAVRVLYDRLAPAYDATVWALEPIGGRALRDRAVALLQAQPGDTVVDLGCGTGMNLPALAEAVGPTGRVIGVDLSPRMLHRARRRADRHHLSQVTLTQADMRDFRLPPGTTAVLATFSLEMVPEHDTVVRAMAAQLASVHGRIALLGLRRPQKWPAWAIAVARTATAVFGVTRAYEQIKPWYSVRRHFEQVHLETAAAGAIYLTVGRAHPHSPETTTVHSVPAANG